MGSDHCPISLTFKDTATESFRTPSGAGNLKKAIKQQVTNCVVLLMILELEIFLSFQYKKKQSV